MAFTYFDDGCIRNLYGLSVIREHLIWFQNNTPWFWRSSPFWTCNAFTVMRYAGVHHRPTLSKCLERVLQNGTIQDTIYNNGTIQDTRYNNGTIQDTRYNNGAMQDTRYNHGTIQDTIQYA